ncbi:STAS domain-containing protein [Streptomyces kunmingensis]|uniref:Anti-sigma factor antagonist n=1 Tax=Streptomyces kunmingensis TaxID=68225 RepID=A0ABU6CNS3_9ACTN|nr:STAS domain-containing protein [Streptomyces kunmingensis]MEB3966385.1 STAS domain-containing protein [Streptomyces kunmingensis]
MKHAAPEPIPDGPHTVLSCTVTDEPDGPVITLSGDLDYETAPDLLAAVTALAAPAGTTVTLDLSGVQFFDSAGINVLLRARGALHERGAELAVRRLSAVVERIFRITGLDTVLVPDARTATGDHEDPAMG